MANEQRLIDANLVKEKAVPHYFDNCCYAVSVKDIDDAPTVDAVVLPHPPRPMLKDCNPYNTDVYCPECGTNLSGYYGEEPLPLVTCFNCGEILDPHKATTKMDGGNEDG